MAKEFIGTIKTNHAEFRLRDTDLLGFSCALTEGLMNGYFEENKEWAEAWKNNIDELRFGKENNVQ